MNNILSYCGLVDARISTSDKDLPVPTPLARRTPSKKVKRQAPFCYKDDELLTI